MLSMMRLASPAEPVVGFDALETGLWTPIAGRYTEEDLWVARDGAPIEVGQARQLFDAGVIEMAQRRASADLFVLLVLRRRQRVERPPYFGAARDLPQTRHLKLGRD